MCCLGTISINLILCSKLPNMQSFKTLGESVSSDQEVFFMGLIDVLTPIFPSHLTCHGIPPLKLLIAAKDSFSEKRRREKT